MITFLTSLIIIIFLHEAAHLLAAKAVKCPVEVFSIGFGKPLFKKKIKDTVYQLCPLLAGGYCKLKGEFTYNEDKDSFVNISYRKKLIIILAGVIINIITGLLAIIIAQYCYRNYHLSMYLITFGYLSLLLGISNALPLPALDGAYPWLVLLEKPFGKKRGYELMAKINHVGLIVMHILNIICISFIIVYVFVGGKSWF